MSTNAVTPLRNRMIAAAAERVRQGRQECHVLAPPGLAAEADAVDLAVAIGNFIGRLSDEVPAGVLGHLRLGEQVLAVHQHRAFAIDARDVLDRAGRGIDVGAALFG